MKKHEFIELLNGTPDNLEIQVWAGGNKFTDKIKFAKFSDPENNNYLVISHMDEDEIFEHIKAGK